MGNMEEHIYLGDDCFLDKHFFSLVKDGVKRTLSPIQYRLLERLASDLGAPVSAKELMQTAWGQESLTLRTELYVYISRLRKKLKIKPTEPQQLKCLHGDGYVLYPRKK